VVDVALVVILPLPDVPSIHGLMQLLKLSLFEEKRRRRVVAGGLFMKNEGES